MTSWRDRLPSLQYAWRVFWQTNGRIGIRIFAASIAYRAVYTALAFLSTAVLLMWLLGIDVAQSQGVGKLLADLPSDVEQVVVQRAQRTVDSSQQLDVQVAGWIGLALSIYGMAGGFAAVFDALNRVFRTYRYTPFVRRYARATLLATITVAIAGSAFVIASLGTSSGQNLLDALNLSALAPFADDVIRLVVSYLLGSVAFMIVLRWGSYARPPWLDVVATALLTGAAWLVMTLALLAFAALVHPLQAYGALAFAIGLLTYGYATSYLFLLAALFSPTFGSVLRWLLRRGPIRLELAGGVPLGDPDAPPRVPVTDRARGWWAAHRPRRHHHDD